MNFEPDDDQRSVLDGLEQLIASFAIEPPKEPVFAAYAHDLDAALSQSGFLDIAREEGFGLLDAALIVERLARLPRTIEAAATMLVTPALGLGTLPRLVALASGSVNVPSRYLPIAATLLVDDGDDVVVIRVDPEKVKPLETLFAYPYGQWSGSDEEVRLAGKGAIMRRRWRTGLAAEAAGCMKAALDTVIEHVTTRQAFGRPLGAFQAIQHRLAMAAETVEAVKWLALRAAWSDDEVDAAIAAGIAQDRIPALVYDLQQFAGAMGLTLEYPLHFWTYRLRALLGELGGASVQARTAAAATWGEAA